MQAIEPTSVEHWLDLRAQDITSTEVSALFNCSPYLTEFELYHRKKDATVVVIEENERMKWGNRLETPIAEAIAEEKGYTIRRMKEYGRLGELRIGASFDFEVEPIELDRLLEIKNVDGLVFLTDWIEDGDRIEAPPHIELQVQHQLLVSGKKFATIGALVGGNRLVLIERERDDAIHKSIKEAVASFWKSIEDGKEPKIDFERDASFISELYGYAEPGSLIDASEEVIALARQYKNYGDEERVAKKMKSEIKAKILMEVGDAEKVKYVGETEKMSIACGMIGPVVVPATERKGYRNFRVTWTKKKEKKS